MGKTGEFEIRFDPEKNSPNLYQFGLSNIINSDYRKTGSWHVFFLVDEVGLGKFSMTSLLLLLCFGSRHLFELRRRQEVSDVFG